MVPDVPTVTTRCEDGCQEVLVAGGERRGASASCPMRPTSAQLGSSPSPPHPKPPAEASALPDRVRRDLAGELATIREMVREANQYLITSR